MKRYSTILIALLLALAVSCYASAQSIEEWASKVKAELGGTEITCAFATHPSTEAFQAMTAEFEELTGIKVNWDVMEETYLKNKQLMDYAGAAACMTFSWWTDSDFRIRTEASYRTLPISSIRATPGWFDYEDIRLPTETVLALMQVKCTAFPPPEKPDSLDTVKTCLKSTARLHQRPWMSCWSLLSSSQAKNSNLYGIAMRAQRGIHFASGWLTVTYNFGDGFLDQTTWEPIMTSPGTVESLKYFVELMRCAPPDVATYTHEEAVSAFMAGRTAMWFDATALVSWILDPAKSQVYDKVGFVPPPSGPIGDAGVFAGWNMAIASGSQKKDAAWAFITFMTSKAKAKEYVLLGGVPTRTSVYQDPELIARDPSYPVQLASFDRQIRW